METSHGPATLSMGAVCIAWGWLFVLAGVAGYVVGDPNAPGDATDELVGGTLVFLGSPVGLLYFVVMRGETVGKRMNRIAVRNARTMERIGYGRALARALVTFIFWIPFYLPAILDGLWALLDSI